jgi:N-acetylmuramoyl-L-alanine amidase
MPSANRVIVIDPGHGGEEFGAKAPDGTPEKALNFHLALGIKRAMEANAGYTVVLTRDEDNEKTLAERVKTAQEAGGHLLLSLHHNALPDGRDPKTERGVATFYYHSFALPFARCFQNVLTNSTEFDDYGVVYDSLHLCRVMTMPSVLLELGFLTYPEDAERCLDPKHQNKVIQAICQGIEQCFKMGDADSA